MLKEKSSPTYTPITHNWTQAEKKINCNICLLAENMRDCKNCPFYTPAKIDPFLSFAKNYLANVPNGAK